MGYAAIAPTRNFLRRFAISRLSFLRSHTAAAFCIYREIVPYILAFIWIILLQYFRFCNFAFISIKISELLIADFVRSSISYLSVFQSLAYEE